MERLDTGQSGFKSQVQPIKYWKWCVGVDLVGILIILVMLMTMMMPGEKGDLQKRELRQAPGAKPSSDTSLLCDLGQVTALL